MSVFMKKKFENKKTEHYIAIFNFILKKNDQSGLRRLGNREGE